MVKVVEGGFTAFRRHYYPFALAAAGLLRLPPECLKSLLVVRHRAGGVQSWETDIMGVMWAHDTF